MSLFESPIKHLQCQDDTYSRATAESGSDCETNFEFDVKPKRKYFETPQEKRQYVEEYTKKKKTELCKNFTLKGECKFGDECSFAHGEEQLQPKQHLHQKYKTKPCKRFYRNGYCCYGNRCQYLHDEIRTSKQKEHWKYLNETFKKEKLPVPVSTFQLNTQERYDLQRFWRLSEKLEAPTPEIILVSSTRLSVFQNITEPQPSRKASILSN